MKKIGAMVSIVVLAAGHLTMAAESPIIGALKAVKANAQVQQAKADLKSLVPALQIYKLNAGVYPTVEQGLVSLVEKPVKDPVPRRWVQVFAKLPKDPWGREYRYLTRKKEEVLLYVVACDGPDPISEKDNLEEVVGELKN